MNRLFRIAVSATAAFVAVGCGQPELIDRTQPNYVKKAELDGVWYIKETIVDAPKTPSGVATVGNGGKMEKIRWEVQEDLLVAYRSYEVVPGADPRVDRENSKLGNVIFQDGRPYKGNPVFAYKILSHFDRQREYNPATGEQNNVLLENTTDRPWYQRQYMRVSWGQNVAANAESDCTNRVSPWQGPLGGLGCINGGGWILRFITDQDQQAQDQAQVYEYDANKNLKYFDWTTQAIINPPSVYYPGYGNLPLCFFSPTTDCESVDVRIRTSVMKVDQEIANDYEPLVYGDKLMTKFGYFRQESYSYSKDYYYTYAGQQFFAMRHNIWDRAHRADGSVIPVTQRAVRPIVYFMSQNTPIEIQATGSAHIAAQQNYPGTDTVEASWDRAFRRAVSVPRGIEPSDVPQMFYVCESPVREGSPAACGKVGNYARLGDLRYNMIPYADQNAGGLLGLGPSAMDPETGMVVSATANIYGPVLDTWAGSSAQIIDVVSGELSLDRLVSGADIKDFVKMNLHATDPRRPLNGPWQSQQPLTAEATRPASTLAAVDGKLRQMALQWRVNGAMPLLKENRRQVVEALLAQNPALEEELVGMPEVRVAVQSMQTSQAFKAKVMTDSSLYRTVARNLLFGNDPIEQARKEIREASTPTIGCFYEFTYSDEDYEGLAQRKVAYQRSQVTAYKAQGKSDEEALVLAKNDVYTSLRREAYRSVTEHEVGHTLGLRHNFIASADALNFHDGYWDLRKETIGVEVGGRRVLAVTPQNMLDAAKPNQRQIDAAMYEYQYSSIMDYGARVNAQNKGTGKYDDAAILFAYSGGSEPGWVEVFNETRRDYALPNITIPLDNQAKVFTVRGAHVELPLAQVEHYTPASLFYTDKYHYSTLPFHFADQGSTFAGMLDQGISRMQKRSFRPWREMEAHYAKIAAQLKDYNLSQTGLQENDYTRARDIVNASGGPAVPVEVPYMFCTDSEVGANLLCNRNDQGADVYEMTTKWIERFEQAYVFENFRRDRLSLSPDAVVNRKFGRYLGNVPNVYQQWLFTIFQLAKYYELTPEEMDKFYGLGDPIYQNYWTMAVMDSTNLLMKQFTIPSSGYHGKRTDGTWEYVGTGDLQNRRLDNAAEIALKTSLAMPANGGYADIVYVPRGPGRNMFTVYDTFGYDGFSRVNEAGHFWDVLSAMLALITSETNFLGVDRGSDALRYSLPYYLTFNLELAPFFNNYWTENRPYFSPNLAKQSDGTAFVQLTDYIRAENFIPGFVYPPAPVTPVDGNGAQMVFSKVAPVSTWTARFYAQFFSMAYFTANYNLEFASFNQVFRLGSGDNLTPAAGFSVVTYEDPFGGGYIYAAIKKTGATEPPAGAAMVERAATYRSKWELAISSNQPVDGKTAAQWETEVRQATRTLEMMRGLYEIFGRAF